MGDWSARDTRISRRRVLVGIAWWFASFGSSGTRQASAATGVLVVVHPDNPVKSIDRAELNKVFLTKKRNWPSGDAIEALNLPADDATRQTFDRLVHGMSPDEVARYWVDRKIRGGAAPPQKVSNSAAVLAIVSTRKLAVGYVAEGTRLSGVRVVATIRD